MNITKDTKLYCSFSANPGNFGALFHNKGFECIKIDAIYVPFKSNDIVSSIKAMESLGIHGAGISAPYKTEAVHMCDSLDQVSFEICAVNTIRYSGNKLYGYNTDYYAIKNYLENIVILHHIIILGNGGYSKTAQYVCKEMGLKYTVVLRTDIEDRTKLKELIRDNTVFNCTPVRFEDDVMKESYMYIDNSIFSDSGLYLACLQGSKQFELYTGIKYPYDLISIKKGIKECLKMI